MTTLRLHCYEPLSSRDSVRLLQIELDGNDYTSPVCCSFGVRNLLQQEPRYIALSYTWGRDHLEEIYILRQAIESFMSPITVTAHFSAFEKEAQLTGSG
jgi:hypothetical protein